MALSYSLCNILNEDCEVFTINNNTVYGSPNINRNGEADVLICAYVDNILGEQFLTVDSTPYDSKISYDINNEKDGHYVAELESFDSFSNIVSYIKEILDSNNIITSYANLVYYSTTQKFYKCIANNPASPNSIAPDDPTGPTYWAVITNFTNTDIRNNTTIRVTSFDFIHDCRGRKCTKDALLSVLKKSPDCLDVKTLLPYLKKRVLLSGARVEADDLNFIEAENITRTLANICPCQTC